MNARRLFLSGLDTYDIAIRLKLPEAFVLKMITVLRPVHTEFVWPAPPSYLNANSPDLLRARRTGVWVSKMRK